ncbi:MAG: sulfite exporter TauE/SafE family protein [Pseudomonadota bacterium]
MDDFGWVLGALGLVVGGILKGATGAGAPIVAVPLLAIAYNVPLAVAVFTAPSLLANAWQGWRYRSHQGSPLFLWLFAGAGGAGAVLGSFLLVTLDSKTLFAVISVLVFAYIAFRLLRPHWQLPETIAVRLAGPVGFVGGVLQGAAGVSAPASLTFLNAMGLTRERFIAVVSVFFWVMSAVQLVALTWLGVMTWTYAALSLAACVPLFVAMPIGAALARRVSRQVFDRIVLALLGVVAVRLLLEAIPL